MAITFFISQKFGRKINLQIKFLNSCTAAMANLLTLNVDHIFEQNNVSEIESINRKIQAEIENKREELRMMVKFLI